MGAICSFIYRWYTEGVLCTPPPCLYSRTLYNCIDQNVCCNSFGRIGFSWAEKYRSQLFFAAFWVSVSSLALMAVGWASLSYDRSTVIDTAWTIAEVKNATTDGKLTIYAGLRLVAYDCDGTNCPSEDSVRWSSADECGFDFCDDCADVASATITTAFFGLISLLPQISTDLQRSKASGDLNCQKIFGIVTDFIGLISSLAALSEYADGCYNNFPDSIDGSSVDVWLGPGFICVLVANVLKLFDIFVHFVVPVPKDGAWDPDDPFFDPNQEKSTVNPARASEINLTESLHKA